MLPLTVNDIYKPLNNSVEHDQIEKYSLTENSGAKGIREPNVRENEREHNVYIA